MKNIRSHIIILVAIFLWSCNDKPVKKETDDVSVLTEMELSEENFQKEEIIVPKAGPQQLHYFIGLSGKIEQNPCTASLNIYFSNNKIDGELFIADSVKQKVQGNFSCDEKTFSLDEVVFNRVISDYDRLSNISGKFDNKLNIDGIWVSANKTLSQMITLDTDLKETHLNLAFEFITTSNIDAYYDTSDQEIHKYYSKLQQVIIRNKDSIQQILEYDIPNIYIYHSLRNGDVELADYNFDGYLDLGIGYFIPKATKYDFGYIYYLYNPQNKMFVHCNQLSDLQFIDVDYNKKHIIKSYADGSLNESEHYYSYIEGKYYLIESDIRTSEGKCTSIR